MDSVMRQFGHPVDVLQMFTPSHTSGIARRLRGLSPEAHSRERPVHWVHDAAAALGALRAPPGMTIQTEKTKAKLTIGNQWTFGGV